MKNLKRAAIALRFCGFDAKADYKNSVVIVKNLDESKKSEIEKLAGCNVRAA